MPPPSDDDAYDLFRAADLLREAHPDLSQRLFAIAARAQLGAQQTARPAPGRRCLICSTSLAADHTGATCDRCAATWPETP